MRWLIPIIGAGVAVGMAAREAEACSCSGIPVAIPADGEVDVPRNVVLLVTRFAGEPDFALRAAEQEASIALMVEEWGPLPGGWQAAWRGTPVEPLDPGEYELVHEDGNGIEVVSSFTVGNEIDDVPPIFAGAAHLDAFVHHQLDRESCVSSCLDEEVIELKIGHGGMPTDAAYAFIEMRHVGEEDTFWAAPVLRRDGSELDLVGHDCADFRPPSLEPGVEYCVRLSVFDLAGHQAGDIAEVCSDALLCAYSACPEDDPEFGSCRPWPDMTVDEEREQSDACALVEGGLAPDGWLVLLLSIGLVWRRRSDAPANVRGSRRRHR